MSDDDEVVFQNSALYEHLNKLGYTDEEVKPEAFQSTSSGAQNQWQFFDERRPSQAEKLTFWKKLKNSVDKAFWDDDWTDQLTQVHNKYADELTDGIMESPVLEEEDGTYIESFYLSMQSYRPEASKGETTIMGTMLMQLAILGASLAYAGFRMVYLKSPDITSRVYVWSIDVIAVLLTIAALTPTTVKSASAGRIVSRLKLFSGTSKEFLRQIREFHKLLGKSVRLLHEFELVARGFTVISPLTPVMKMGGGHQSQYQCPRLRRLIFLTARDVMLSTKFAAQALLRSFPSHVEIEGLSSYLANQPLYMYGPCVTNAGDGDEEKLRAATDNYSLTAVKAMVKLCNVHISEFLRVLAMSVLTGAEENDKNPSFRDQETVIKKLKSKMESHMKPVSKLYTLHKCLYSTNDQSKRKPRQPLKQSPVDCLYIAVHSLSLHLQAAQHRVHLIEEELEKLMEDQESQGDNETNLPDDSLNSMNSDLKIIQVDLNACQDCLQESQKRVDKYCGKGSTPPSEEPVKQPISKGSKMEEKQDPIPLFEIGDPVIQDQVFEAYVDTDEPNTSKDNDDMFLSEEDKAKSKEEKQAAIHMLRELKSVIAVRAIEREERERQAFQRQYPDAKFYDPMPALRSDKEAEQNDNGTPHPSSDGADAHQQGNDTLGALAKDPNLPADEPIKTAASIQMLGDSAKDELKEKLASIGGANFAFSSTVAAMAAARSHQMAAMSEETFGDEGISDGCSQDEDDDDDDAEFVKLSAADDLTSRSSEQDNAAEEENSNAG